MVFQRIIGKGPDLSQNEAMLQSASKCQLFSIYSRSDERARAFSKVFGISATVFVKLGKTSKPKMGGIPARSCGMMMPGSKLFSQEGEIAVAQ